MNKRKVPDWLLQENKDFESAENLSTSDQEFQAESTSNQNNNDEKEEVDDYLNMLVLDKPSSLLSLHERKRREREERGKTRAPAEIEAEKRDMALKRSLLERAEGKKESKAAKIMRSMGYTSGQSLGAEDRQSKGILEPLAPVLDFGSREGIGGATARKEILLNAVHEVEAEREQETSQYRQVVKSEHEIRRIEAQLKSAQKVCETLDSKTFETLEKGENEMNSMPSSPNIRNVPVFWRGLIRDRKQREREVKMRQQMMSSLPKSLQTSLSAQRNSSLASHSKFPSRQPIQSECILANLVDEDGNDISQFVEDTEDEVDEELDTFEDKLPEDRRNLVLKYLREKWHYCFFCGCQFNDENDLKENCPGELEEDH